MGVVGQRPKFNYGCLCILGSYSSHYIFLWGGGGGGGGGALGTGLLTDCQKNWASFVAAPFISNCTIGT